MRFTITLPHLTTYKRARFSTRPIVHLLLKILNRYVPQRHLSRAQRDLEKELQKIRRLAYGYLDPSYRKSRQELVDIIKKRVKSHPAGKISLILHLPESARGDPDNYLKIVLDALQGAGVIRNDRVSAFRKILIRIKEDRKFRIIVSTEDV